MLINEICNWSCFCSWCWSVWKRWRNDLMDLWMVWKWPSSGLFLSVSPGAISLFATPSGVTTWTVNETLTLTCNGPVGTVEGNTQVRWLLRCCTGMFFSQIRGCNTQVNHFLCCMKLFSQIRGCRTQLSRFLCCRLKVFTYSRGCNT